MNLKTLDTYDNFNITNVDNRSKIIDKCIKHLN